MRAHPWRIFGRSAEAVSGAEGTPPEPAASGQAAIATDERPGSLGMVAARVVAVEPWTAPLCALVLLLAPNPLVWPAAVIGVLPSLARLLTTGRPWRVTAFDVPLALLAIGALLGGWASLSRDGALLRLHGLLAAFILFAVLREHARGTRVLGGLVLGSLLATVVSGVLLLVLVGPFLLLERVPLLAGAVAAVDRWQVGVWFTDQDWLLQRYRFRASGVGALADIGLALAVAAFVGLRRIVPRVLVALTVPFFLLVLLVADNRGAMLAGAMTLGAMVTVWRRRLLPLVPVVVVLGLLVLAFGPVDRGLSLKTLSQRFWFWENSVYLAREVPLTGAGLGLESVQLVYRAYFLPSYPPFSHAHNIYLQGLLEYGVFGLLGLLGLGVATLWAGWRAGAAPDRWTLAARLAGFGMATAMLTTGLTEIVLLSTVGGALALAAVGLLAGTVGAPPPSPLPTAVERGSRRSSPLPIAMERGWGWGFSRLPIAIGAGMLVLVAALVVTGLGNRVAARLLLNAGTADLNRGSLSETIRREDRSAALDRAAGTLKLAASITPDDATIQRNLALALAFTDDARGGRAAADRAKALTPPTARAETFQLGRMFAAMSNWGDAIRSWQAAEAAPQLIQLGNRLIRARNYDQAINAFVATARVDPASRSAYEGITRAAREGKESVDGTVQKLAPLMAAGSPTELGARLQAARVLREAGRLGDASAQLRQVEAISSPAELSFEYGLLWMAVGLPSLAEPVLIRPAADLPYDFESYLWLARAQSERGKYGEAIETIRRGLSKIDPSGQFAPPAERLPETAAVRATEIKRPERALMLGVMGESLIRRGRAGEAIPVLEEAVAALPKDPWLARTLAEARAAQDGSPPNLLFNPAFDRQGSWAVRTPLLFDHLTLDTLLNEAPTIDDGQARLAPEAPESRLLTQEVVGLDAGGRYRATVRLRAEGLGAGGGVRVLLLSARGDRLDERVVQQAEASQWVTVTVEAQPGEPPADSLRLAVGFVPGTPTGATVWCDEATLIRQDRPL